MGHLHFPHLIPHGHHGGVKDVPKGCLAIKVGHEEEEKQRFVVPIDYFNHPLFLELLKEAEKEYGFDHKGTITLPCHVTEFLNVQDLIDGHGSYGSNHNHGHHNHHHPHHHHHLPVVGCFRA